MRFLIFFLLFIFPFPILAQENIPEIKPVISVEEYIPVGESIILDAKKSELLPVPAFGEPLFVWKLEDTELLGIEQLYTFQSPGRKKIILEIHQGEKKTRLEKEVFVYQRKALLITDEKGIQAENIIRQAEEKGTWLQVFSIPSDSAEFLSEERIVQGFNQFSDFIQTANLLIFYAQSLESFTAFTRYYQTVSPSFSLEQKQLVVFTEGNMRLIKNIIRRFIEILHVQGIFLTRPEALSPILESNSFNDIQSLLELRGIEFQMVNGNKGIDSLFVLSSLITYLMTVGIPANVLYLLLVFPLIAFLVAFSKQLIGLSSFGVYLPTMIGLSFFVLGITFTFLVIGLVGLIGLGIRLLFYKIRLLYVPKVALTLSFVTLSFFFVIWLAIKVESSVVIGLAIFPMLVISTLSERFIAAQAHEGLLSAFLETFQTIFIAFFSYLITSWSYVFHIIISFPEFILLPLLGIVLVGRYSGLQVSEYIQYRSLFSKKEGIEE